MATFGELSWEADGRALRSACGWYAVAESEYAPGVWYATDGYLGGVRRGTRGECVEWCERRARLMERMEQVTQREAGR